MLDIQRAKRTPSVVFSAPQDVVEHTALTPGDKVEILLQWRYDALQLETAQGENMQSNKDSQLRDVLNALHELDSA